MSEIEKLMQNANIKKKKTHFQGFEDWFWEYPPFTAEKQLELIKWLIREVDYLQLWNFYGKEEVFDFDLGIINAKGATFEETLAKIINKLWQSLTDVEKEQIKEILKG